MNVSTSLQVWIGAAFTLALLSFLYKENPAFRLAENAFVGASGGHALVVGYQNIRASAVIPLVKDGEYIQLVPIVLGLLFYAQLSKKGRLLSTIPVSFLYGVGIGTMLPALIKNQVIDQIAATVIVPKTVNHVLIVVGVLLTLSYFVFTFGTGPALRRVGVAGRVVLMVAFGVQFGNMVLGRAATLVGRLNFLLGDWLGILKRP